MRTLALSLVLAALPPAADAAAQRVEETRAVEADARIEVSNVRGRVTVRGWERDQVEVTGTLGDGVKGLVIEGDGRRLVVRVDYPKGGNGGWFGWWGGERVGDSDITVLVPRGASLEVESVSAEIDIEGLQGADLEVESVSGSVRLDSAPARLAVETVSGAQHLTSPARDIRVETVSGSIEVSGAGPDTLRAETVSGDVTLRLSQLTGDVSAETVSGGIRLALGAGLARRARIESMSGAVELNLPRTASARLSASSFSGGIRSDVGEVERTSYGPGSSLTHVLGNGEADVSIESFSGSVRIQLD